MPNLKRYLTARLRISVIYMGHLKSRVLCSFKLASNLECRFRVIFISFRIVAFRNVIFLKYRLVLLPSIVKSSECIQLLIVQGFPQFQHYFLSDLAIRKYGTNNMASRLIFRDINIFLKLYCS